MAKYRQINTEFWDVLEIASLDPTSRYLYLYLKTNKHMTTAGCCRLPVALMCLESGLTDTEVRTALIRLATDGLIKYDYADEWIALRDGVDGQTTSPKIKSAINAQLSDAPGWVGEFIIKSREGDARAGHPAIQAVRDISNRYPARDLWDPIIDIVGDEPDMELLQEAHAEWSRRGYSPLTYVWIMEWVANGHVPKRKNDRTNADILDEYNKVFST